MFTFVLSISITLSVFVVLFCDWKDNEQYFSFKHEIINIGLFGYDFFFTISDSLSRELVEM